MNCPHCGAPLPNGDVFCGTCGLKIESPVPTKLPTEATQEGTILLGVPTEFLQDPSIPVESPTELLQESSNSAESPTELIDLHQAVPPQPMPPQPMPPQPMPPRPMPPQPKPPRAKRGLALPILCICLAAALIISGVFNAFQWMQSSDLQADVNEKAEMITALSRDLDNKSATINEQNLTIVDQEATIQEQSSKLWFYEEYVVVVPDDGSELYHTYGCDHFDDSYFWAFNLAAAEQTGYTPCPYCQ